MNFKFTATDPEDHQVYYWIAWGGSGYTETFGPYSSGDEATISHSWGTSGTYTINAKTIDQYGAKSGLTTYQITISKSRALTNPVLFNFIQNIIDHFPIIKSVIYMGTQR